jgi:hypothetical protein
MANLKNTTINDTSHLRLPSGTTAQRPGSPVAGMVRYNTDLNITEYYDGSGWIFTIPKIQNVTNLISDPSVELNTSWSYSSSSRSTTYSLFGNTSIFFPNNTANPFTSQSMPTPIANNIYYGGRWIFTAGATVSASDLRFEWFIADNPNSQMVFAFNNGTHSVWTLQTSRLSLATPTAGSWIIRHFTVDQTGGDIYTDGFFIINLTSAFGSGNEPSKQWCDKYYDFNLSSFVYFETPY